MSHDATGESMPPETMAINLPWEPSGMPPTPLTMSVNM